MMQIGYARASLMVGLIHSIRTDCLMQVLSSMTVTTTLSELQADLVSERSRLFKNLYGLPPQLIRTTPF